jgi:hypothetical protein
LGALIVGAAVGAFTRQGTWAVAGGFTVGPPRPLLMRFACRAVFNAAATAWDCLCPAWTISDMFLEMAFFELDLISGMAITRR